MLPECELSEAERSLSQLGSARASDALPIIGGLGRRQMACECVKHAFAGVKVFILFVLLDLHVHIRDDIVDL